ncbi:hypothetical protein M0802_000609 [Mischocyttarus mexicanus]|nr:hypothetical protein M0802_000609 [Mischocyttarus mexicanus]
MVKRYRKKNTEEEDEREEKEEEEEEEEEKEDNFVKTSLQPESTAQNHLSRSFVFIFSSLVGLPLLLQTHHHKTLLYGTIKRTSSVTCGNGGKCGDGGGIGGGGVLISCRNKRVHLAHQYPVFT